MKYKCVVKDSMDVWLTEGKVYDVHPEPVIPPIVEGESWLKIFKADDGHPAFVRAKQMQRVFDEPDDMKV